MHRLKNRGIIVLTVIGLFAFSGIAMADEHEDTIFNYGYDQEHKFLIWNLTSLDYDAGDETITDLDDCRLGPAEGEEAVTYSYTVDGDGISLTDGDPVNFEDCNEPAGGSVLGPQQQVNHGMFLRLFNMMYEGDGNRGCLVRHIAQSDLGKGDQQFEADPEASDPEPVEGGSVDFTTVETDCIHGPDEDGNGNGNGKGKPDWAGSGKPDWAPGPPPWAGNGGGPHSQNS